MVKRQVFDIPPPKIEVTEHQAEVKYCECCNKTISAAFPAGVLAPVQYGEVIRSWSVYYQYQHFIPEDRLQQLFSDLYGIQLATATLTGYNRFAFDRLESFEESILSAVKIAAVKNLDETGFRVAGKTQWLHVASTKTATYYHVSPKRKSLQGAEQFARIRGFISTVRKQGLSIISSIQSVFSGTIPVLSGI